MPKKIVILCDGTGNQISVTTTNVLKFFRVLTKDATQRVFYNPGLGTMGARSPWLKGLNDAGVLLGLATGFGLDRDVLWGYAILCTEYEEGDEIWLFGFSRGAYTVRVLAGFVHLMGLLTPDQLNIADRALDTYKRVSGGDEDARTTEERFAPSRKFKQIARGRDVPIRFLGLWDTVSSILIPRGYLFWPRVQVLPFTRTNPGVQTVRHAASMDERRRMFRLNRWLPGQMYKPKAFDPSTDTPQDFRTVWFAGVHADVGGGYPDSESGLAHHPLLWMLNEARTPQDGSGLKMRLDRRHLRGSASAVREMLHQSLTPAWWPLEVWPKKTKWQEWRDRPSALGLYLPLGEPRLIEDGALIHKSVVDRMKNDPGYRPENLPESYTVV